MWVFVELNSIEQSAYVVLDVIMLIVSIKLCVPILKSPVSLIIVTHFSHSGTYNRVKAKFLRLYLDICLAMSL